MDIFSVNAPKYWAAGISVIPLISKQKRPAILEWSDFCERLPTPEEQQDFLNRYRNNNIGVALGKQSGMVFVDIDSVNDDVVKAIHSVIPKSPWIRIGAKGCVMGYKYNGESAFKISDSNNKMLVEVLGPGNQAVLPPSIHPDTGMPYTSNVELIDVYDKLPFLPDNLKERLRAALSTVTELRGSGGGFNVGAHIPPGARDTALTQMAGLMSFAVIRGDKTLREALSIMQGWTEEMTGKVSGDNMDPQKGKAKLIEFIMTDVTAKGKTLPPGWDVEITPEEKVQWGLNVDADNEEWTAVQLKDYIIQQLTDLEKTDPKRQEVVNYVLKKISKSPHLSEIDRTSVVYTLKKNDELGIPVSSYLKQIRALTQGPVEGTNHTDIAQEVVKLYEERFGKLAYYNEEIWQWKGSHWKVLNEKKIWEIIANEYGEMNAAKRASDHRGIIEVIKAIIPQHISTISMVGVNFSNGFLTEDINLVKHEPEQGMTYILPYCYDPEKAGKCPMFMNYLHQSWGHHEDYTEKKMALQEAMAVTIFGMAPAYQRAFLLHGTGGTGKSIILEIIQAFVPDEARCAISPHQWNNQFACADFSGALLNSAGELDNKKNIDGEIFKKVVSGDEMQVEHKGGHPFKMKSKAAQWFASNYFPKTTDVSHGFNRRWLILTFDKVVGKDKVIRRYGQMIAHEEVEGIVAWAIEALPRLLENGEYTLPPSHEAAVKQMSLNNSIIRQWMDEKLEFAQDKSASVMELFKSYFTYSMRHTQWKTPSPGCISLRICANSTRNW